MELRTQLFTVREIRRLRKLGELYIMGEIIEFMDTRKRKLNTSKVEELRLKMSEIISDAELTEMADGDILMDAASEARVKEIEGLIHLEYLKAGCR